MIKRGRSRQNLQILSLLICIVFGSFAQAEIIELDHADESSTPLQRAGGIVMFDYKSLDLDGGGAMDLVGAHYLHRFGDWFYLGPSISGPMVQGEYGGFFAFVLLFEIREEISKNHVGL